MLCLLALAPHALVMPTGAPAHTVVRAPSANMILGGLFEKKTDPAELVKELDTKAMTAKVVPTAIVKATPAEEPFTKIVSGVSPELMQRLAQNQLVPKERLTDLGVGNVAPSSPGPLTVADVEACQANWANAIQTISKTYLEKGDYIQAAADAAGELYGYGHSKVLFKPTKAAEEPFRPTGEMAMSYFVGSKAVENGIPEDGGFAINGGKGWSKVVFKNHDIELQGDTAIAMGTYWFTCATTGDVAKVEYTFGYKRNEDGKPRIFLHHSSVPYSS